MPGFLVYTHGKFFLPLRLPKLPTIANVSWRIELRENPHAPKTSKLHDVPDVLGRVHLARAVRSVHCQLRNSPGVEREAVGVRDVPVEYVELVVGHPGDDLLDDLHHKKENSIKVKLSPF